MSTKKTKQGKSASTYLAVFLGGMKSPKMKAWKALPEAKQKAVMQKGMAAWHAWVKKHKSSIVVMGGPLGKTIAIDPRGMKETSNGLCGYIVVHAKSHKDAAKMFVKHPHFTNFPGESVEIMPVLAIPGM